MEQSLRLILTDERKPNEQNLINVYNKLTSSTNPTFSSDLYILLAERFFDLPTPIQKINVDRAEKIISLYSRLQEPLNQFQIRSQFCQSLICSYRAQQERGELAKELTLKALEVLNRALKSIQSNSLYNPLALRACYILYQISYPFFSFENRTYLLPSLSIAVPLLETHLTGKFDNTLKLYIAMSLLYGCVLDDSNKSDDATKHITKLFTHLPSDTTQLRYSLLHILVHFSRKSPGNIIKLKLDLNENIQKAIVLYQTARSVNPQNVKDLTEAFKILTSILETRKDYNDDIATAEIVIGEIGRLSVQTGNNQLAIECQGRAQAARSPIARFHAALIIAEINVGKPMEPIDRAAIVNNLAHQMTLAASQGDIVTVQDAAAIMWSHCLQLLDNASLIKKSLTAALDLMAKCGCQSNLMRSQMHFALGKMLAKDGDLIKAADQLKKGLALDYAVLEHPTKLMHPFDRFLLPEAHLLAVTIDAFGQQPEPVDAAFQLIAIPKRTSAQQVSECFETLQALKNVAAVSTADVAAHHAAVWSELAKRAYEIGENSKAVEIVTAFLAFEWDPVQFDTAVETQCEAAVVGICANYSLSEPSNERAQQFINFVVTQTKELKKGKYASGVGSNTVWSMIFHKTDEVNNLQVSQQITQTPTKKGSTMKRSESNSDLANPANQIIIARKSRFAYNAITAIWNSYYSKQDPQNCTDSVDFLGEIINVIFDIFDFNLARNLVGEIVNFYTMILLYMSADTSQTPVATPQNGKKKTSSLDPQKQKLLKQAEDTVLRAIPVVVTISEKKALVDRLVEIFARRNALPPNMTDPDTSILVQLATIMNEKVQHKTEVLASAFQQVSDPIMFALIAESALKLEIHQLAIDSATKTIDGIPKACNKDDNYYLGLSYYCRGMTYLRLIQPDLQEFSTQDNLRRDASSDFLKSAKYFFQTPSMKNATQSLHCLAAAVAGGEEYPKFRMMVVETLQEAITVCKKVPIESAEYTRMFMIYLQGLIDLKDWKRARTVMQSAIQTLPKSVHADLWELNLVITANLDCEKNEIPLIDEMLRVKQMGDEKFQSKLWTFVGDLAKDPEIQRTAFSKALDVLRQNDNIERFNAGLNLAKWLTSHGHPESEVINVLEQAEAAIADIPKNETLENRFHLTTFALKSTTDFNRFRECISNTLEIIDELWSTVSDLNAVQEEDEVQDKKMKKPVRNGHKSTTNSAKELPLGAFAVPPSTINGFISLISSCDNHKKIEFNNPYLIAEEMLEIINIFEKLGHEFTMLKLWYFVFSLLKAINVPRFEHVAQLKFRLFADRLNITTSLPYPKEFGLTDAERSEWSQIVGRYASDPKSKYPPLRQFLVRAAEVELEFGEYKQTLVLLHSALMMAEQVHDNQTRARCLQMEAMIESRSGNYDRAIELLSNAVIDPANNLQFWANWYMTAFGVDGGETYVDMQVGKFTQNIGNKLKAISDIMISYEVYEAAAEFMSPDSCAKFLDGILENSFDPSQFLPTVDLYQTMFERALKSDFFPKDVVEYRTIGNRMINLISITEELYHDQIDDDEDSALPFLIRYIRSINLFGALVVKYQPTIQSMEENGIDYDVIGSHASLLTEFVDKIDQPLPDLSATAAILHFHSVQHIKGIPKHLNTQMISLLGQCLHIVADDNVTKQNAVKYLIQAVKLNIDEWNYEAAGSIALETFSILKESDPPGAMYHFIVAQASAAFLARMDELDYVVPSNRELLFMRETQRLRKRFFVPESSEMMAKATQYFNTVMNGTHMVTFSSNFDQIKTFLANRKVTPIVIDSMNESLMAYVLCMEKGTIESVPLSVNLDEVTMKYDIFKQIIAPPKKEAEGQELSPKKEVTTPPAKGKKQKKTPKNTSKAPSIASSDATSNFAREALKLNNPEFIKFISELEEEFSGIRGILPEQDKDAALILSSNSKVHEIPFECLDVFTRYQVIYRDFSIASAMKRQNLSTVAPSFGIIN